jgi:hypothetical protein
MILSFGQTPPVEFGSLCPFIRRHFRVLDDAWVERNSASELLKVKMIELLNDWGAFLDVNLYREALVHFLSGISSVCKPSAPTCNHTRMC